MKYIISISKKEEFQKDFEVEATDFKDAEEKALSLAKDSVWVIYDAVKDSFEVANSEYAKEDGGGRVARKGSIK